MSGSKKISELTELTTANAVDVLPIVDTTTSETKKITKGNLLKEINTKADNAQSDIDTHKTETNNPHGVTAEQVGADPAGSADVVQNDLNSHKNNKTNPHNVSKTQVGLGNVDNTADVDKPISTAQQEALDSKADLIDGKVPSTQLPSVEERIETQSSTSTLTFDINSYDVSFLTAQAEDLTIANSSNTKSGDSWSINILDNGTARSLSFGTEYVGIADLALPTTTVAGKWMEIIFKKVTSSKVLTSYITE